MEQKVVCFRIWIADQSHKVIEKYPWHVGPLILSVKLLQWVYIIFGQANSVDYFSGNVIKLKLL